MAKVASTSIIAGEGPYMICLVPSFAMLVISRTLSSLTALPLVSVVSDKR
jgi:hypothetical protein